MTREEQRDNTITELYKNKTSSKTLELQAAKTARSKAEWFWTSTGDEGKGTYDVGRRTMKRERLADKKLRAKQFKLARLS